MAKLSDLCSGELVCAPLWQAVVTGATTEAASSKNLPKIASIQDVESAIKIASKTIQLCQNEFTFQMSLGLISLSLMGAALAFPPMYHIPII